MIFIERLNIFNSAPALCITADIYATGTDTDILMCDGFAD